MTLKQVADEAAKTQPSAMRLYAVVDKSAPRALRVQLGDEPARLLHATMVQALRRVADLTFLPYGPVVLCPGGHCLTLKNTACARLVTVSAAVSAHPTARYDPKAFNAPALFLLAAELKLANGRTVIAYREQQPTGKLARSKSVALLYRDGRYDRLDPTDVLLLDLTFDVVTAEGTSYFDKKRTFERLFDHLGPLRASAKSTFSSVTANLRINGLKKMEQACTSDMNMMAKMASIARSMTADPAYARALTMPKLLKFIDGHPQYAVRTVGAGAARKLVFESTPAERYKILHLLDDDYLQSQLTQRSYETGSKIPTA
jgi:hypothetical protein